MSSIVVDMAIPPVDPDVNPYRGPEWLAQPYARFARTAAGRWLGINVLSKVDPHLLRISRGKVSIFAIYRHVTLTATGRKSGQPRSVPLLYLTEGEDVMLMASSFGRDQHPAWYHNVIAHLQVTLTADGVDHSYVARELEGEERDAMVDKFVRLYAGYGDYVQRTRAVGRTIPVLALRPGASVGADG